MLNTIGPKKGGGESNGPTCHCYTFVSSLDKNVRLLLTN